MGKNKNDKKNKNKLDDKTYEKELRRLQIELVKLQDWVKKEGKKIAVVFEGRDAAGKGGMIKRITEPLNHRICRVVALGVPTEKEKTQWYLQRYVSHLPAAGEIVLFDRSWYNRAGVEKVMGFCTDYQYDEFLRICPGFEEALIRSGIMLYKYWLDINAEEQEERFQERLENPMKQWKISPMDMYARSKWYDYEQAKDDMLKYTDTEFSPWYIVDTNDKKSARLNCISHLLDLIPYKEVPKKKIKLPPLQKKKKYKRSKTLEKTFVPKKY
ncbi:MAG: polyphosphate kinase 2 [Thermodesulfobacteriota bacterium]|nr:MAG: polyphosphate kinase 2 [Thermodesulfobacteriota bacterium]